MFLFGCDTPPEDIGKVFPSLDDGLGDDDLGDDDLGVAGPDLDAPSWRLMRRAIAEQVLHDTPPETWATAQRLQIGGADRHEALDQLARGLFYGMATEVWAREETAEKAKTDGTGESSETGQPTTITARIAHLFDWLPLPHEDEVSDALVEVVAGTQGTDADGVPGRVLAELGRSEDDRLAWAQARLQLKRLIDDGGVLAALTGGRIVNRQSLASSVVLTHRLTEAETVSGELRLVASDLCLFADTVFPTLSDGAELDLVDAVGGTAWAGPSGWLGGFSAGELVTVRRRPGATEAERVVTVEPYGESDVEVEDWLVEALRQAFADEVDDHGAAIPVAAVVAHVAIDHPDAFAVPRAPVTDLAAAAGLELRGSYAGTDPAHWRELREEQRHERLHERCTDDDVVHAAIDALADMEHDDTDADELREILRDLRADEEIAELVVDELAPPEPDDGDDVSGPAARAAIAERVLAAARRAGDLAVARWIAGVVAERDGDVEAADTHFRAGWFADPAFGPLVDRCAWYASDRGDAAAAARLWRSLEEPPTDELETVAPFAAPVGHRLGRNEPCWCGSGRKYKVCHQRQPEQAPLPERIGWMCRKATSYLMRHGGSAKLAVVGNVVALAGGDEEAMFTTALRDPLVVDAALHEGGWFARFLAARGSLLPDDEQLLAASWMLVDRTVFEVISVDAGEGLVVQDLRTGEELTVSERTLSHSARAGTRWCARAVPDGAGHQFVGGVFPVAVGQEAAVLELCDRRDPLELCGYVAATRRTPELRTREGEAVVECEAVLRVDDPSAAADVLDDLYRRQEHDWVEMFDLDDDESIVRATLSLDGDRLSVLTHSTERMDRALAALQAALPTAEPISDERQVVKPGEFATRMPGTGAGLGAGTSAAISPAEREEIITMMEQRWLAESVPALGGLTPRQAAADPTRREQVARLIDSFPELDGPLMTMRPVKLRAALGL